MESPGPTQDEIWLERSRRRCRPFVIAAFAVLTVVPLGVLGWVVQRIVVQGVSTWALLIPLVLCLPLAGAVAALVANRRGDLWFPTSVRLGGTDPETQRRIGRAVRRGELPAQEPDRGLALEAARVTHRTRHQRWIPIVVLLTQIPSLLGPTTVFPKWITVAIMVVLAVLGAWQWVSYRNVARMLRDTDGTDDAEGGH